MKRLEGQDHIQAEKRMQQAAAVAKDAKCLRAKAWSVIVKDGEIIGKWYNSPPCDTTPECCKKDSLAPGFKSDKTCCMHAEQRAIIDALTHHPDKIKGSTLYFARADEEGNIIRAGKPYCTMCSKLALDCGAAIFALFHEEGIVEYDTHEYNELSFQYDGK